MGAGSSLNKKNNNKLLRVEEGDNIDNNINNLIDISNDHNFSNGKNIPKKNNNNIHDNSHQNNMILINSVNINYIKDIEINKSDNNFYKAYISMKEMLLLLNKFETVSLQAYLINTKTIKNFIDKIKKLNILKDLITNTNKNEISNKEEKLKKDLDKYILEDNIKIIYEYKDCINMINNKNEEENEFIIVDELFCREMKINDYYDERKKVDVCINKENSTYEIQLYTDDIVYFTKKETGFYKFIE